MEVTAGPGQVNFSAGMIGVAPSRPTAGGMTSSPTISEMGSQQGMFETQALAGGQENHSLAGRQGTPTNPEQLAPPMQHSPAVNSEMSMIDPALMPPSGSAASMFHDSLYGSLHSRPEHQYAQSYERYRSPTPGPPTSVQPALSRLRQVQDDFRSPPTESVRSPSAGTFSPRSTTLPNVGSPTSTPPFYGNGRDDNATSIPEGLAYDRPIKRVRYQTESDLAASPAMPPPNLSSISSYNLDSQPSSFNTSALPNVVGGPLTPASSHSDDGYKNSSKLSPHAPQESPDLRRLSVNSLLSGPPGMPYSSDRTNTPRSNPEIQDWSVQYQDFYQDTITYGIDRGFKDLDIGKNDDLNAISGSSPVAMRDHLDLVIDEEGELLPVEFGFGMETNNTAFENGGYYDKPVAIQIPRILEPLPNKLMENHMNLLVS
jgi:hypothetical protein